MSVINEILITAAPLLAATTGALISEFAGIMAIFIDGIINLSAFLFYAGTVWAKNPVVGFIVAFFVPALIVYLAAIITENFEADPFLTALAVNLFSSGIVSFLSMAWFKTRGVLTSEAFSFAPVATRELSTVIVWIIVLIMAALCFHSTWGIRCRITGSNPDVLIAHGLSPRSYRIRSWVVASTFGSLAGTVLVMRLSSFVPNISSGRGWMALAAVFLGSKNGIGVIIAVLVFASAEYLANILPSFSFLSSIPTAVTLALPYFAALILIIVAPKRRA